jgi:Spy/CpxP family protein refolding chaperone
MSVTKNLVRLAIAGAVAVSAPLAMTATAHAAPAGVWDKLAMCESTGNWSINTGNGFSGGLQFTPQTWRAFGGKGQAHQASREEQIAVAERVLATQGWGAWPACSRKLGLR